MRHPSRMLKDALRFIRNDITPKCYDRLMIYPTSMASDKDCLRIIISKILGYLVVLGSIAVKLPQIVAMVRAQSSSGISIASVIVELIAITSTLVYSYTRNFPFSAWGDSFFMAVQTFVIANLWFYYRDRRKATTAPFWFTSAYVAFVSFLLSSYVPPSFIAFYQSLNLPIIMASKGLQIYANIKNGSTGQLSALSFGLISLGSVARIFTSIQETGDLLLILPYVISSILNVCIVGQVLYYTKSVGGGGTEQAPTSSKPHTAKSKDKTKKS